jgi:2-dehydro-3-deoxygluconokinase
MNTKVVTLGEVMMRLSTPGHERFLQANEYHVNFGGAEANVAIALSQWGIETTHITAFPNNDIGTSALHYLRRMGVGTSHIDFFSGRMGLYFLENGVMQRSSKIIYDRFDSTFAHFKGDNLDWDAIFANAAWFHFTGITPAISQNAADLCLRAAQEAKARGVKISGDINYRRNLWQYGKKPIEVMPELISYCDLIVAGLTDFDNCAGIKEADYLSACKAMQALFANVKYITTTERESIRASHNRLKAVLWNGQELMHSKLYEMIPIVDRVGGGDAFMAGLIYGLLHFSEAEALEFAVASSVLKHSIPGDANLVSLKEVKQLVSGENIGMLMR